MCRWPVIFLILLMKRLPAVLLKSVLRKKRIEEIQQNSKVSLDDLFQRIQEGEIKDLNIVVKADVQGTIEALRSSLQNIKN